MFHSSENAMRILFAFLAVCVVAILPVPQVVARKADANDLAKVKTLAGIVVLEKDGELISVDFRKCDKSWVDDFPRILKIPSIQSVSLTGPMATHEIIVSLAALPNLRSLRLDQTPANDETVAVVSKFPKIEEKLPNVKILH